MKEKNCSPVRCLPARPGFWWKLILITEQMKKLSFHLHKRHTCLIHRHPQGGSHKPVSQSYLMQNIAQWMKNRSMQISHYEIHCTLILNRYLSASALKVFWKLLRLRMQSTEGWQENKCQWQFYCQTRFIQTPVDLYSFCQPWSPLQHNLSSTLGMYTQLPQVHGAPWSPSSPFSSSLLSPWMSLYSKSEFVPTGSSRKGSRPSHSQGWSRWRKLSCIILQVCKIWEKIRKFQYLFAAIYFQGFLENYLNHPQTKPIMQY